MTTSNGQQRSCPERDSEGNICGTILIHGRQKFCHYHQHKCYGVPQANGQPCCNTPSETGSYLCFRCNSIFQKDSEYLAALDKKMEDHSNTSFSTISAADKNLFREKYKMKFGLVLQHRRLREELDDIKKGRKKHLRWEQRQGPTSLACSAVAKAAKTTTGEGETIMKSEDEGPLTLVGNCNNQHKDDCISGEGETMGKIEENVICIPSSENEGNNDENKSISAKNKVVIYVEKEEDTTNFLLGPQTRLLVFPFDDCIAVDWSRLEKCAEGLNELSMDLSAPIPSVDEIADPLTGSKEESRRIKRTHSVVLCKADILKLEPGIWFNDNIVDFFML